MKKKDLRKEIVKALEGKSKFEKEKCLDCIGHCNFGKFPYCKSTLIKLAWKEKGLKE